jgi:hypothetical protein
MHRDHWIPADDRTIVFRLFVCSLTPIASRLLRLFGFGPEGDIWGKWRVVGGRFLKPIDCFGESGLDGVLGGISVP